MRWRRKQRGTIYDFITTNVTTPGRPLTKEFLDDYAAQGLRDQGVVAFPTDRRALARRRWRHRLWVATPALIFAVVIVVLMILFYSGPAPCEPYMNC